MIVVEGPDGAGKSTLIERLKLDLGLPVADRSMTGDLRPLKAMGEWIEECVNAGFQDKIYDRFALISGPLYAPIMDDKYQLNLYNSAQWMFDMHWRFYRRCKPVIIYCLPPIAEVRDNVRRGDDNEAVKDKIERIYQAYVVRAALDHGYPDSYLFDYTRDNQHGNYNVLRYGIEQTLSMRKRGIHL